jgi:ABC-type polysaccharide/polyol phosphate transport system ATPase subunit
MKNQPAIAMENVGKTFRLRPGGGRTLKAMVVDRLRGGRAGRVFTALDDVCFEVAQGETLGIIGANGSGKSTLLSIAAGAMTPTRGTVTVNGVVSSLLELGAGFHPELTGRENVFLYGAILGLSRETMRRRFDAIVDFAGIADYIDQPVRHYSSGMYVRLGFAVAVEVDPDILLIDEALAVGDADFQAKCLRKMRDFKECGKTMLMVSHDLATIQSISDRILLLDGGRVLGMGEAQSVVNRYRSISARSGGEPGREWGTGAVRIAEVLFLDRNRRAADVFRWGEPLTVEIRYRVCQPVQNPVFGFSVSDKDGRLLYGGNTQIEEVSFGSLAAGEGLLRMTLDSLCLATGAYLFSFSVHSADHKTHYHRLDNRFPIVVEAPRATAGPCYMPCRWERGAVSAQNPGDTDHDDVRPRP